MQNAFAAFSAYLSRPRLHSKSSDCAPDLFPSRASTLFRAAYATVFATGAVADTTNQKELSIGAGSVVAFDKGIDDSAANAGCSALTLKASETNAASGGVIVENGDVFVAVGMAIRARTPFVIVNSAQRFVYGTGIAAAQRTILENAMLTLRMGKTEKKEYTLGVAAHWPAQNAPGDGINGQIHIPDFFQPFVHPIEIKGSDEKGDTSLVVTLPRDISVANTAAEIATALELADAAEIYFPLEITLLGQPDRTR